MSSLVKQAVFLVGGRGSRINFITKMVPKPLIKINDKNFLFYLVEKVKKFGINNFVFLCGYKHKQFEKFLNRYLEKKSFKIVIEKKPLGTGGALSNALKYLDDYFLLFNGDSYLDLNLHRVLKSKNFANQKLVMCLVKNLKNSNNKLLTNLNLKNGRVRFSRSKSYINSGIYLFSKKILNVKPFFSSLEKDIIFPLIKKKMVKGIISDDFFIDIGSKKTLSFAKKNFSKKITNNKAVFFDRDGVLIKDKGYTHEIKDLKWQRGALKAIKYLNNKNYYVVVVTNQSGIGRGYYSEKDMILFHNKMNYLLRRNNAYIDFFYFSPYYRFSKFSKYRKNFFFRKPNPGMLVRAIKDLKLSKNIFMIGDQKSDYMAAKKLNIKFKYFYEKDNLFLLVKKFIK
jgi:D-glycero-D-manno-heptose 1,7-bisphosphate phosphatase